MPSLILVFVCLTVFLLILAFLDIFFARKYKFSKKFKPLSSLETKQLNESNDFPRADFRAKFEDKVFIDSKADKSILTLVPNQNIETKDNNKKPDQLSYSSLSINRESLFMRSSFKQKKAVKEKNSARTEQKKEHFFGDQAQDNEILYRLLIVDDQEFNTKIIKAKIEKNFPAIYCDTAKSGEEAGKMVMRAKYDLIFMDIQMPGISGIEAAQGIKNFDPESKIIALTSLGKYSFLQDDQKISAKNNDISDLFDGYLSKVSGENFLLRTLKKWLPAINENFIFLNSESNYTDLLRNKKVLLIDDNPVDKMKYKNIFESYGMEVLEGESGKDLLKEYQQSLNKLCQSSIDVIFCDMKMPKMSGDEAVLILRKIESENGIGFFEEVPIIGLSGDEDSENINGYFRCGITDYFIKNQNIETLLKTAVNCLNSKAEEQTNEINYQKNLTKSLNQSLHGLKRAEVRAFDNKKETNLLFDKKFKNSDSNQEFNSNAYIRQSQNSSSFQNQPYKNRFPENKILVDEPDFESDKTTQPQHNLSFNSNLTEHNSNLNNSENSANRKINKELEDSIKEFFAKNEDLAKIDLDEDLKNQDELTAKPRKNDSKPNSELNSPSQIDESGSKKSKNSKTLKEEFLKNHEIPSTTLYNYRYKAKETDVSPTTENKESIVGKFDLENFAEIKIIDKKTLMDFGSKEREKMTKLFFDSCEFSISSIERAISRKSSRDLMFSVHSLKGICANIGAERSLAFIRESEPILQANPEYSEIWLKNFKKLYAELQKEMEEITDL